MVIYTCYNVRGNINDPDELMELSNEVLEIIGAEQGNGIVPFSIILALSRNVCIPAYLSSYYSVYKNSWCVEPQSIFL